MAVQLCGLELSTLSALIHNINVTKSPAVLLLVLDTKQQSELDQNTKCKPSLHEMISSLQDVNQVYKRSNIYVFYVFV